MIRTKNLYKLYLTAPFSIMILPITTNINKIKLNQKPRNKINIRHGLHDKRPIKTSFPPLLSSPLVSSSGVLNRSPQIFEFFPFDH